MNKMTSAQFLLTLSLTRKRYADAKASWEAEVAYHSENGHRPSHCIHGTNQWTEYDNICGGCEDGVSLRQMVVEGAYRDVAEFYKRSGLIRDLQSAGAPVDLVALWDWAVAPIK